MLVTMYEGKGVEGNEVVVKGKRESGTHLV